MKNLALGLVLVSMLGLSACQGRDPRGGPASGRPGLASGRVLERIVFGSCSHQDRPQPIWNAIRSAGADLFVFLGDNVYGDSHDMAQIAAKYERFSVVPEFAAFRGTNVPIVGTWDDHDFGWNDAGVEYAEKEDTKRLMLDFLGEPAESARRKRAGVYDAYTFGPAGRRVQVILLDTRWFRSPLKRSADNRAYLPDDDSSKTILGEEQWRWLEERLREPADLRILGSSIQLVSEERAYEKWANLPRERARLYELLERTGASAQTIVVSGDRHHGELSCETLPSGARLCDLTSSGLNMGRPAPTEEPNRHRVAMNEKGDDFGVISIDWSGERAQVQLELRDEKGETVLAQPLAVPTR